MLTSDLALSWRRGRRITPRFLDPESSPYLQVAADLIAIVTQYQGCSRGGLDEALDDYIGAGTDYRVRRGLIKLLLDRCSFEIDSAFAPGDVRRALFNRARAHHPVLEAREQVIAEAAAELGAAPEALERALYADLPENQTLVWCDPISARELIDRYNLAQAQALLYRCLELKLWIEPQSTSDYRQLFGAIKAYRLIHQISGRAAEGYEVRLTGPVSMFHRSQKYGIQMAVFLPALLLFEGWRLQAEIGSREGDHVFYDLDARTSRLRSHYLPASSADLEAIDKLVAGWSAVNSEWRLEPSREVIALGSSALVPDLTLLHPDGRKIYLELLGFWTPRSLEERLSDCARGKVTDYLLVAAEELRCSREAPRRVPSQVIMVKKSLSARELKSYLAKTRPDPDRSDEDQSGEGQSDEDESDEREA
jgi:predicted nuclease of restriction endonuclease-like RecB superfamily